MTQVNNSNSPNHRFAWLTPLQDRKTSTGPWVLCENRTQHLEGEGRACVSITVTALLHLLASIFSSEEPDEPISYSQRDGHCSECGGFEVRRSHQPSCTSRLFVQKRADYFQRLELHIDQQLVAAYQEPVWPHLQHRHQAVNLKLTIPAACIEFIEHIAEANLKPYRMQDSANQAQSDSSDETVAA